jgi:formate hydrogenlyase subunit 3/multisubunit Na+/H+ antiporter MnhD subunit
MPDITIILILVTTMVIAAVYTVLTPEKFKERRRQRLKRFWFLPVIIIPAVVLAAITVGIGLFLPVAFNNVVMPIGSFFK